MKINSIVFCGKPNNYAIIDKTLSRSAQPLKEDFLWLKAQGVTDIINFRTMYAAGINFDEKVVVENLSMNYYNIPSHTSTPDILNIQNFLNIVSDIKSNGGKAHIHCMAGADRTGMYSYIYKTLNGMGTAAENLKEWLDLGHDTTRYPNLIEQTNLILKNFSK